MHFKSYAEIKNLHKDTTVWPIGVEAVPYIFKYDRNRITERHSCDIPMRNGTTGKATRYLIPTVGGGRLNVCIAAYRAIERVLKHHQPEELDRLDVAISRVGGGMNRYYDAYPLYNDGYDDVRHLGVLRGKADFNHPPENNFRMEMRPGPTPTKNVIIDNLMPAKAVCRCDIKDLCSTGHTPGCPEKRR
jgi:hypothetical protein